MIQASCDAVWDQAHAESVQKVLDVTLILMFIVIVITSISFIIIIVIIVTSLC